MDTTTHPQCAGANKPPAGLDPKRIGGLPPEEPSDATLHNAGIRHRVNLASAHLAAPKVDETLLVCAELIVDVEFGDSYFQDDLLRRRIIVMLAAFASGELRDLLDYIEMGCALDGMTTAIEARDNQN